MMKMIAEKETTEGGSSNQDPAFVTEKSEKEVKSDPIPPRKLIQQHQSQSLSNIGTEDNNNKKNHPAGSGLAVVRQRANSLNDKKATPQAEEKEEEIEESDATLEQLEAKRQFSIQQSKKIAAYLAALTEQKKKEELEKKKKEDRQKKRVMLLGQRLLKEAQERKLMILEDKPNYREVYSKNNSNELEELEKNAKKPNRKVTIEMAENIAQRLAKKAPIPPSDVQESAPLKVTKPPRAATKVKTPVADDSSDNEDGGSNIKATMNPVPNPPTVPYRDFNDWKRKNGVPQDGKVFCMTGWYPCVKQALLDRGWYFNPDPNSPFCHLKWTLRSVDVNQDTLQPWQLTNHYLKNVAITTKAGLIKSLKSLIWMANIDIHDIIPRAYDLTVQDDMISFLDDYRNLKAENILKSLYYQATGLESPIPTNPNEYRPLSSVNPSQQNLVGVSPNMKKSSPTTADEDDEDDENAAAIPTIVSQSTPGANDGDREAKESETVFDLNEFLLPQIPGLPDLSGEKKLEDIKINSIIFEIACQLLENQLKSYNIDEDDNINVCDYDYCPTGYHEINTSANNGSSASYSTGVHPSSISYPTSVVSGIKLVSDLHWEIIDNYSIFQAVSNGLPFDSPEPLDGFIRNNTTNADEEVDETTGKKFTYQQLQREKRRLMKIYEEVRESLSNQISKPLRSLTLADVQRIHKILCQRVLYHYGTNQFPLNGKNSESNNLWIVKPAAKSRGRGIMTFGDINKLLKYIEAGTGLSTQWIVQKYMENSLIIAKRKFDMRQWILVTSWNPLTIYFYNECYARFSVDEYSTDANDLSNLYAHLVNNSIGKNSENFNKVVVAENGQPIEGYMWDFDTFGNYLKWKNPNQEDILRKKIQPRMKEIAIYALMCASEMIEHRKKFLGIVWI